jgi:FtsH-binding integral membrane protein
MSKKVWLLIIKYWGLNIFIPSLIFLFLVKIKFSYEASFPVYYVIFVAPFIFYIFFHRKIKKEANNKMIASCLAIGTPYILLLILAVYLFFEGFVNFIPFG